jgi:hypothetical protein
MPPRKSDTINSIKHSRTRRVSLTFRVMVKDEGNLENKLAEDCMLGWLPTPYFLKLSLLCKLLILFVNHQTLFAGQVEKRYLKARLKPAASASLTVLQ